MKENVLRLPLLLKPVSESESLVILTNHVKGLVEEAYTLTCDSREEDIESIFKSIGVLLKALQLRVRSSQERQGLIEEARVIYEVLLLHRDIKNCGSNHQIYLALWEAQLQEIEKEERVSQKYLDGWKFPERLAKIKEGFEKRENNHVILLK